MDASRSDPNELRRIEQQLLSSGQFGSIRVREVHGELSTDRDGDPILRFRFTLDDPAEGQGTWSLDDVEALQRETERLVAAANYDVPSVVIEMYPKTVESDEEEPGDSDEDLTKALDAE